MSFFNETRQERVASIDASLSLLALVQQWVMQIKRSSDSGGASVLELTFVLERAPVLGAMIIEVEIEAERDASPTGTSSCGGFGGV